MLPLNFAKCVPFFQTLRNLAFSDFFFHKMSYTQNLKNQETDKETSWKNFLQSQNIEHPSGVHM